MEEQTIQLNLSEKEANVVLNALGQLPYVQSAQLINRLMQAAQSTRQVVEKEE